MNRLSILGLTGLSTLAFALASPAWAQKHTLPPIQQAGQALTEIASFDDDFRLVGIGVTPNGRIFATAPANDRSVPADSAVCCWTIAARSAWRSMPIPVTISPGHGSTAWQQAARCGWPGPRLPAGQVPSAGWTFMARTAFCASSAMTRRRRRRNPAQGHGPTRPAASWC